MNKVKNTLLYSLLLSCFANCHNPSTSDRDFYSYNEWNYSLMDSVRITFSIDSIFKPKSYDWECFDEGGPCHIFGNDDCKIVMNYEPYPKKAIFESLTKRGEVKTTQIRDAYPQQRIAQPQLIKLGLLDGVIVESSGANFVLADYAGYNKEMYMWFDIKVRSRDSTTDVRNILLLLVKSISIQKKE